MKNNVNLSRRSILSAAVCSSVIYVTRTAHAQQKSPSSTTRPITTQRSDAETLNSLKNTLNELVEEQSKTDPRFSQIFYEAAAAESALINEESVVVTALDQFCSGSIQPSTLPTHDQRTINGPRERKPPATTPIQNREQCVSRYNNLVIAYKQLNERRILRQKDRDFLLIDYMSDARRIGSKIEQINSGSSKLIQPGDEYDRNKFSAAYLKWADAVQEKTVERLKNLLSRYNFPESIRKHAEMEARLSIDLEIRLYYIDRLASRELLLAKQKVARAKRIGRTIGPASSQTTD